MRDPERTKAAILEAAEQTLIKRGMRGLTLEDVAAAAAVSKGGLLHHYASKVDLILGVLERQIAEFNKEAERRRSEDPAHPGSYTRAILRTHLENLDEHSVNVWLAIMSEARTIPAYLAMVKEHCEIWDRRIENDGLDPVVASIVRFAGEGLLFSTLWGLPKPENYAAVVERLLQMTQPSTSTFSSTN